MLRLWYRAQRGLESLIRSRARAVRAKLTANFRAIRYFLFSLSVYAEYLDGSKDAAAPTNKTNKMKAVIEEPICTQTAKSVGIEGDLMLGRKYDEHIRTKVVKEYVLGALATFAMIAQKRTAAAPRTKSDTT